MRLQPSPAVIAYMRTDEQARELIKSLRDNQKPEWATFDGLHYTFDCSGRQILYVIDVGGMETVIRIKLVDEAIA